MLFRSGAGNQVNGGIAIPGAFGNPQVNDTIAPTLTLVGGTFTAAAAQSTGPAPIDTETLTSAPVSGATTGANITLSSQYQG